MRIVVDGIITDIQRFGGISRVFREVTPRLCALAPDLHIEVITNSAQRTSELQNPQIQWRTIPPIDRFVWPLRWFGELRYPLREWVIGQTLDFAPGSIWHSTYYTCPADWRGRVVVTVHDLIHERFPDYFSGFQHDVFRSRKSDQVHRADAVICVSSTTANDVMGMYGLPPSRISIIHNSCSPIFRRLPQTVSSAKYTRPIGPFLLCFGTNAPYKNLDAVLDAYAHWRYRSDIHLVIIGDPRLVERMLRVVPSEVRNSITVLAGVDDEWLCHLYNQAEAFLFPSRYEGFGIPLLEAMACGCPVIASNIPSTVEVAGEYPIYFELGSRDSLISALDIAIAEGKSETRRAIATQILPSYSWDLTASKTLAIYQALEQSSVST